MKPASRPSPGPVTFRFENIGPVRKAELDLGGLTVIAGRNNTGKTYLVYTLYGFLMMWDQWPGAIASDADDPLGDRILAQVMEQGEATVAVGPDGLDTIRRGVMRALTRSFSTEALAGVFNSPTDAFEGASLAVDPGSAFPGQGRPVAVRTRAGETFSAEYDGKSIRVSGSAPGKRQNRASDVFDDIRRLYLRFLFPELSWVPFVLSAERFGISLFYRELDFTKNQLVDLLQKMGNRKKQDRSLPFFLIDESLSRYALPIKHNIDYTRSIFDLGRRKSEVHGESLFNDIRSLMSGYYRASSENIEFRSTGRGARRFAIPLHLASSSARGLSDLYFFLRHVARKDHLLIIDEPEGHLDTANQIRLARLLARMVRAGLRVLLTTHSDYLVKEINNLVMLNNAFPDKAQVAGRLGYGEGDSIAPETIRAYVAENDGLTRCTIDKFGIDMPIFDETIDGINRVADELASRVAEDQAG